MSSNSKNNHPIQQRNGSEKEIDICQLKKRFDKQLPKYGFLWKSMAKSRLAQEQQQNDGEDVNARKSKSKMVDKENIAPSSQQSSAVVDTMTGNNQQSNSERVSKEIDNEAVPSLLDAILNKRSVSLRASCGDDVCADDCNCVDPIIEIEDEDASVYDVDVDEELADTDDDDDVELVKESGNESSKILGVRENSIEDDESVQFENLSIVDDSDDDESIVILSKTPKKKRAFVIDSDEEDESDDDGADANGFIDDAASELIEGVDLVDDDSFIEQDDNGEIEESESESRDGNDDSIVLSDDDSVKSNSIHSLSDGDDNEELSPATPAKRSSTRLCSNSNDSKSKTLEIMDDDAASEDLKSASSEEPEWIELSSDEEEEVTPPRRVNTIVILSDDEEESESDDARSAFTISDDSDDGSEESDDSSFRKSSGRRTATKTPRTTRRKTDARTKPTKRYTTPKENTRPNNNSQAKNNSSSRSTLAFRKNRDALTSHTFSEFNQKAFQNALSSVEVSWSNKFNTTAGVTRLRGKLGAQNATHTRTATIELATKVIDDEERLRSTLLHEMCHAAQWLVDGVSKPAHGACFKKWGAISMRKIRDVEVTTTHDYQIVYKFAWACTASNCNVVIKRHSRSVNPTKQCCGRCQGKLIEIEPPGSKGDVAKVGYTAKKERKASEYALFVKDQSANVRQSLAQERSCTPKEVSQGDVMKGCGKLWRSLKEAGSSSKNCGSESGKGGMESMVDKLVSMTLGENGAH